MQEKLKSRGWGVGGGERGGGGGVHKTGQNWVCFFQDDFHGGGSMRGCGHTKTLQISNAHACCTFSRQKKTSPEKGGAMGDGEGGLT
jgi:hypothetical protein